MPPTSRRSIPWLAAALVTLWLAPAAIAEEPPVPHVYTDAGGSTHLVRSLDAVPPEFRARARALDPAKRGVEYQARTTTVSAQRLARARAKARADASQPEPKPDGVIFYTASWCGYCDATRRYLLQERIPFEERSIDDPAVRRELTRKIGQPAVPVVQYENKVVIGYNPKAIDRLGL